MQPDITLVGAHSQGGAVLVVGDRNLAVFGGELKTTCVQEIIVEHPFKGRTGLARSSSKGLMEQLICSNLSHARNNCQPLSNKIQSWRGGIPF